MLTWFDDAIENHLHRLPLARKLVRYSAASVAGVVTSQLTLFACFVLAGLGAATSNVIAVGVGAIPSYAINRAWTWERRGNHSLLREVVPFWAMSLVGLVLSTFAVAWAADRYDDRAIAVSAANIGAFGVLWIAKFFVLDRVLFAGVERDGTRARP